MYTGLASHYNEQIVAEAIALKVILVLLPSNSTHLIQPLNAAVLKPFKTVLKRHIDHFLMSTAATTISKKDSIAVSSKAWTEGIVNKPENIGNGFKASGIWPLSFPKMQSRWESYHDGGIPGKQCYQYPLWLKTREAVRVQRQLS